MERPGLPSRSNRRPGWRCFQRRRIATVRALSTGAPSASLPLLLQRRRKRRKRRRKRRRIAPIKSSAAEAGSIVAASRPRAALGSYVAIE